jgi:hypothetical protein
MKLKVRIPLMRDVLNTTLCDKVYRWLATGQWHSSDTPVSTTNKTERHDITEILLKSGVKHRSPNNEPPPLQKIERNMSLTFNFNLIN